MTCDVYDKLIPQPMSAEEWIERYKIEWEEKYQLSLEDLIMRQITTDEIVRILCGDTSVLDEVLEDVKAKNDTKEDNNCDSKEIELWN